MRTAGTVAAAAVLLSLCGCADAARDDVQAVAAVLGDPGTNARERCLLLAPATREALEDSAPCVEGIDEVLPPGGEVGTVEVWGREAQVRIGSDVVFLTRTEGGWRVTAAACRPRGERPYDCEVEGS